jgi:hypothetical protein
MADSIDSKILAFPEEWKSKADSAFEGAKTILGYNVASSLTCGDSLIHIEDVLLKVCPELADAEKIYAGLTQERQNFVKNMYPSTPETYFLRISEMTGSILQGIDLISRDTTADHAKSISEDIHKTEQRLEDLSKETSLMCKHIALMYGYEKKEETQSFWQNLIGKDKKDDAEFTSEQQEYFLNRYKPNLFETTKVSANSTNFGDTFETKIEFKVILCEGSTQDTWTYEIEHKKEFDGTKKTTESLSIGGYMEFNFYIDRNPNNGEIKYWHINLKGQDTSSNAETSYKEQYYQHCMKYLNLIQAQINVELPGALSIAQRFPTCGPLPLDLLLQQ